MGGGGGLGTFGGGSVGGVSNPALGQPQSPPLNPMQLPAGSAAPMMGWNAPTPAQAPSGVDRLRGGIQKAADISQAWQDAGRNLQQAGAPFGQQQRGGQPVNFNIAPQAYVPPPQMQNNPFAMSNAFYGG